MTRIAETHERRNITPDTALRLARYFNTSARFWLNAQAAYDSEVAQDELQRTIERDVHPTRHKFLGFRIGLRKKGILPASGLQVLGRMEPRKAGSQAVAESALSSGRANRFVPWSAIYPWNIEKDLNACRSDHF